MADVLVENIILSPKDFHIKKGQTIDVTATIIPSNATNKEVKWSLPQGGLVTVRQEGNVAHVKGVQVGATKLMCSSLDGNAISSSGIWIDDNTTVYANEILISPSSPVIELGKSVQFNALVLPEDAVNKNVSWSTTIGSYARVSIDKNGLATGILVGRGFVRASVSSVSNTVDVDVVNPEGAVLVKKITISQNSLNLKKGDKIKLTATVSPSNATCKNIIWRTPQGAVTTVDQDGNVVAVSVGTSRIIAVSADGNAENWIQVKVTESDQPTPAPDEEPKYAVHLNPHNITVRKGQPFMVRVRAMDVENISKSSVYKDNFLWIQYLGGGWKWSPSSDAIEFIRTEFINTHEAAAWFRAGCLQ